MAFIVHIFGFLLVITGAALAVLLLFAETAIRTVNPGYRRNPWYWLAPGGAAALGLLIVLM